MPILSAKVTEALLWNHSKNIYPNSTLTFVLKSNTLCKNPKLFVQAEFKLLRRNLRKCWFFFGKTRDIITEQKKRLKSEIDLGLSFMTMYINFK